jgi:hypothetical protein
VGLVRLELVVGGEWLQRDGDAPGAGDWAVHVRRPPDQRTRAKAKELICQIDHRLSVSDAVVLDTLPSSLADLAPCDAPVD